MKDSSSQPPYTFPSGAVGLKPRTALITGTGRSGKTTLGNILATYKGVEYADEPWSLHITSVMAALGIMEYEVGREMFLSYFRELVNDTVLMRNANFRPSDLSTILTKKTSEEIQSRLTSLNTREDVARFIAENKPLFLLAFSADPAVNLPALTAFMPESPVIYVVRRGIDVAHHVEGKGWFSEEQLRRPTQAQAMRKVMYQGSPAYVYSWVPEDEEETFLGYSEFERGLMYWCTLVGKSIETLQILEKEGRALVLKYEDLIEKPHETLGAAANFLHLEPSSLSDAAVRGLEERDHTQHVASPLPETLQLQAQALYKHFGYDWK